MNMRIRFKISIVVSASIKSVVIASHAVTLEPELVYEALSY